MYYKFSCPVPKEQRPINEYLELVQSNFFNWPILLESVYKQKIVNSFLSCFLLSLPISFLFLSPFPTPFRFLGISFEIATIFLLAILIRLLLSWNYIKQRLYNPTVFYEESGWYDGRIWVKSKNILVQDRLIYAYQVLPAIKRLNESLLLTFCLSLTILLLLIFF